MADAFLSSSWQILRCGASDDYLGEQQAKSDSAAARRASRSGSWLCMEAFVSVYVNMAATADAVRAAVAELPNPKGVFEVTVDCNSVTDTFGCRITVDLTGTFDEQTERKALKYTLDVPWDAVC